MCYRIDACDRIRDGLLARRTGVSPIISNPAVESGTRKRKLKDLLPLHYRLTKSGMLQYKEKDEKL